jgi:hypothetical protein
VGSDLKLDRAYIDEPAGQAFCIWSAPNRQGVETMFNEAGVRPESVREVKEYCG